MNKSSLRLALAALGSVALAACASPAASPSPTSTPNLDEGFPSGTPTDIRAPAVSSTGTFTVASGNAVLTTEEAAVLQGGVGTFTVNYGNDALMAKLVEGAVVLVPGTESAEIVRVVKVQDIGDGYNVQLAQATLTDLAEDADFTVRVEGQAAKADMVDPWIDVDLSGKALYDKDGGDYGVKLGIAEGRLAGNPAFAAHLQVSHTELHLFQLVTSGFLQLKVKLALEAQGAASFQKTLEIPVFEKDILAVVGGVPVWLQPYVRIEIAGEADVDAQGAWQGGFVVTLPASNSVAWTLEDSPHWSHTSTGKVVVKPIPLQMTAGEANGQAKITVGLATGVKLYKRVTGELKFGAWVQGKVALGMDACQWTLDSGATGDIQASLDGLGPVDDLKASYNVFQTTLPVGSGDCSLAAADAGSSDTDATGDTSDATAPGGCTPIPGSCDKTALLCCLQVAAAAKEECVQPCGEILPKAREPGYTGVYAQAVCQSVRCAAECELVEADARIDCVYATGCEQDGTPNGKYLSQYQKVRDCLSWSIGCVKELQPTLTPQSDDQACLSCQLSVCMSKP